jgi:hypothetical protein
MRRGLLAALAVAGVWAHPAGAATHGCDPHATVRLALTAAAHTPSLGTAGARTLARQLTAAAPVCDAAASARVRTALGQVAATRDPAQARRLLRALLASIGGRSTSGVRLPAGTAAGPCDIDREIHVRPKSAPKVGDYLAVAKSAFLLGDEATGQAAIAGARQTYTQWASSTLASATSVGDFISIAAGAQMLGLDGAAKVALDRAQRVAEEHYKAIRAQMDPCFPTKRDLDCQTRAVAILQLLGVDEGQRAGSLTELADAVAHDKPVGPCEEWAFTMQMTVTDDVTGAPWTMQWNEGRFRMDPTQGRLAKSDKTWPGNVGNDNSSCIEETPDGRVNLGPATIVGGPFHYSIDGSVGTGEVDLSVSSQDGHVSVTAPSNPVCQFLADFAEQFLNGFVTGPLDLPFELAAGQTSVTYHDEGAGYSFDAAIHKVS